jgi:hypothetical protein
MHRKWIKGQFVPGESATGRKVDRDGRRDHLERRKDQIEAQIASLNARDEVARRKRDTRANIILGAVIRAHAASHPAFMPMLADILSAGARRRPDRELLAAVLELPQLIDGSGNGGKQQPISGSGVGQPHRPRLVPYAAEITARR